MPKKDYDEIIRDSFNLSESQKRETALYKYNDMIVSILFTIITIALIIKVYLQ